MAYVPDDDKMRNYYHIQQHRCLCVTLEIDFLVPRLNDQGYQSGFTAGCSHGLVDGFAAGQREGAAVCSEVNCITTFSHYH